MPLHFRVMLKDDIPQVLDIYGSDDSSHADDINKYLRENNCNGMMVELNDKPVGFMIYEVHMRSPRSKIIHNKNSTIRSVGAYEKIYSGIIITMYGISANHKKKFTKMVDYIKNKLTLQQPLLNIYVKESDLYKQIALQKQGYVAIDIIKKYYDDTGEDAYVMQHAVKV
mgnify:FL=1